MQSGVHVGGPGSTANVAIAAHYGGAASDPGVLILNAPAGQTVDTPAVKQDLARIDAALAKAAPDLRRGLLRGQRRRRAGRRRTARAPSCSPTRPSPATTWAPAQIDQLTSAAKQAAPDLTVGGTSYHALEAGNTTGGGNSSVLSELLVGALGALLVLAWVFGSFLALLPLIMALISVLTMQIFIYGLTYIVPSSSPINPAVQYIVALLGLGLSIDYSLLVVTRWREERTLGKTNHEAVLAAVKRAGHSVWFSGVVASLGLFALIVVPNSMVRGVGISGLFIPSTATLVALTLLPAILSKIGPRVDWPRRASRRNPASRFWTGWSKFVIKHRVASAVVGLGVLGVLAGTAAGINIAQPGTHALASAGSYTDGLATLQADGFPSGTLTAVPVYVPHAADAPAVIDSLSTVSSLRGAALATGPAWSAADGSALVDRDPADRGRQLARRDRADRHPGRGRARRAGRRRRRAEDRRDQCHLRIVPAAVRGGRGGDVPAAGARDALGAPAGEGRAAEHAVGGRDLRAPGAGLPARCRHAGAVGHPAPTVRSTPWPRC